MRLERLAYDDGGAPSQLSVATAFELSYRRLDESSGRVFRLLPVNPGPDVSTTAAAVLADLPDREVRMLLAGLARAHLAEAAPSGMGRWRMHDLVRLYAQRLSDAYAGTDGREQACGRLLEYYLKMARAADVHLRALRGMTVPQEFADRESAVAWLDAERLNLVAAVSMAVRLGLDQIALLLPNALAMYLDWRRRFDDWIAVATIGVNTARRLGDRHRERMALVNLGGALVQAGRVDEAITTLQEAVGISHEVRDRKGEGMALDNLGSALVRGGRFEEAITAREDAIVLFRETGDRNREGMALDNLGNALSEVGRFEEAITAREDAIVLFRETGDRNAEGMALDNLGGTLREVRRFGEAIALLPKAVVIFRETGDRYGEGLALNNLGCALQDAGRYDEAIAAHQDAATIFQETGDPGDEDTALRDLERARIAQQRT